MSTTDPILSVESWALEFGTLHPRVRVFLKPYFGMNLQTVRIRPTRLRGSIYALGGTILFRRGTLNAEYDPPVNRGVDLATVGGMRIMAHELFHIQQWRRGRLRFLWSWLGGLFGYLRGNQWHDSTMEREAVAFSKDIAIDIRNRVPELLVFKELR